MTTAHLRQFVTVGLPGGHPFTMQPGRPVHVVARAVSVPNAFVCMVEVLAAEMPFGVMGLPDVVIVHAVIPDYALDPSD